MNYSQKLFIQSVIDLYSDVLTVTLQTGECSYVYSENRVLEEVKLPGTWEEIKHQLVKNIEPEDRDEVLAKWDAGMTPDAVVGTSFSVDYHIIGGTARRRSSAWQMRIDIVENSKGKQALIFSKDDTLDIKKQFQVAELQGKDRVTHLYNRITLHELMDTEYQHMECCGVMCFDINDFKQIWELYGPEEKDKVLTTVSEYVRDLENEDVKAFRMDRDEFLIIAKNCPEEEFRRLIDCWIGSWGLYADKEKITYTVALGNAWEPAPVSVNELIAKAKTHMYCNKKKMKNGLPMDYYLQEDRTTQYGLHNREQFLRYVTYRLKQEDGNLCIVALDIEHFKLFKRWYGADEGAAFLAEFAEKVKEYEIRYKGVGAYTGGDKFMILLPDEEEILRSLEVELKKIAIHRAHNVGFLPVIGIYQIAPDSRRDAEEMYDMAMIAARHAIGDYQNRSCYYDEKMTTDLEQELNILNESRTALARRQFFLVLQPKCRISTGKIVGAEALVRWRHPEKGLISPGTFVPILEKNGFISDVDLFVWEETCKVVRKWMNAGITPVPISINVSRIDMLSMNVVEELNKLIEKYRIDRNLIRVEVTESAYVDNADQILENLKAFSDNGFKLLMDDFGSGYSSLNMLRQSIVDVLKLDMKFLDWSADDKEKGITILKSVIKMTNEMDLPIIVEGVETEEQANLLNRMKVRYAQGYLYYRPMPVEDFEELIKDGKNVDYRGVYNKKSDLAQLDEAVEDILTKDKLDKSGSRVDLNTAAMGFFSYFADGDQELIIVDDIIAGIYGYDTVEEFRESVGNSFKGMVHPDDWKRIQTDISEQIGSSQYQMDFIKYRIPCKEGKVSYACDFAHLSEDKIDGRNYFRVFFIDLSGNVKV